MFKYIFTVFTLICFNTLLNGQIVLKGTVYKSDSISALDQVMIIGKYKLNGFLTNATGRFLTTADSHDIILFKRLGYYSDTLYLSKNIQNVKNGVLEFNLYMKETTFELKTFQFVFKKPIKSDPYEKRKEWSYVLDRPRASAQSPITALYQQFSKKGKELQKLEDLFYQDEMKRKAEERFSRLQAILLTGLKGRDIDLYLTICRPTYDDMLLMTDYDLINYMKQCFEINKFRFNNKSSEETPADSTQKIQH